MDMQKSDIFKNTLYSSKLPTKYPKKYVLGDSYMCLPLLVCLCDAVITVPTQDLHHTVSTTQKQPQVYLKTLLQKLAKSATIFPAPRS
jgi:hypothetical protein